MNALNAPIALLSLTFSLTFTLPLPVQAQEAREAQEAKSATITALDRIFAAHMQTSGIAGLSVGIVQGGRLVFAKGYGGRSLEARLPVETDTRFSIGSVTKQFTCACVFLLAEADKLSVRDPVAKFFPGMKQAKDITLLDLMNHTSGYPDYYPLDFVDRRMARPIEAAALLEEFAGAKAQLDFAPGSRYSYSNTGYILLGEIIEKVSGQKFGEFLQQRILDPLGMTRTIYDPDPKRAEIAKGYTTFALGPAEKNMPEGLGWVGAAGGIYSTPTDLAKWDLALLQGKVVNAESWSLMTRRRRLTNGSLTNYGCGLSIATRNNRELLSHGGAINGFRAFNGIIPSMQTAVILFCNQDDGLGSLADQALEILLRDPPTATPTAVPEIKGPAADEVARKVFGMLQRGKVDRALFTADFNDYLNDDRVAGTAQRLGKFGSVNAVNVTMRRERGGMEVTSTRLTLDTGVLRVLMYRHPDGSIAQFFVRH